MTCRFFRVRVLFQHWRVFAHRVRCAKKRSWAGKPKSGQKTKNNRKLSIKYHYLHFICTHIHICFMFLLLWVTRCLVLYSAIKEHINMLDKGRQRKHETFRTQQFKVFKPKKMLYIRVQLEHCFASKISKYLIRVMWLLRIVLEYILRNKCSKYIP